ncbi:hypothetical protein A6769_27400 [Nostoc punctiforme NIES-2108]|uniref:Uncharacterized protein n=1 Tax=Nostoc punctiforme NIES-2108 TaxID=1356359 RepID=A0A367RA69_NOSPU|nr:hypothetical protein A6769_27400 [Nostoc punctiforme NIES-2108]
MKLGSSAKGLILYGYNPVYPGTQTIYSSYSPDNFLFGINPDGSLNLVTYDDADRCSEVEVGDN